MVRLITVKYYKIDLFTLAETQVESSLSYYGALYVQKLKLSIKPESTYSEKKIVKSQNLLCLTVVTIPEAKQSSVRPQFYATIVNPCAFWGSDECAPSVPCIFFSS